ncbi:MAG: DUF11 domain-containing protein [Candidatus Brocadiae bacterium]|nr:DUF11 domain-containing protein [Candidatus Brocadiia bacterium]
MKFLLYCILAFFPLLFAQQNNSALISTGPIQLTQTMPKQVLLNKMAISEILLVAQDNACDIVVTCLLSDSSTYSQSEPQASLDGKSLVWKIDRMNHGENRLLKIFFHPVKEGTISFCTKVVAVPMCCVSSFAGKAILSVSKKGPEIVKIGEEVVYEVTVKNVGTALAEDVSVIDEFPKALVHANFKNKVGYLLGNLAPGVEKTVNFVFKAVQREKIRNMVLAKASNAETVRAFADTSIVLEEIALRIQCPNVAYIGKKIQTTVFVSNPGDTKLTDVVARVHIPKEIRVVSLDFATRTEESFVIWDVGNLLPGAEKAYDFSFICKEVANTCFVLQASSQDKSLDAKASCCTVWKGMPAFLLEVQDTVDPLLAGQTTEYIIEVTNQGSADDSNIKIVAKFPAQLSPVEASGPTSHRIDGKFVVFSPYPTLKPKEKIVFKIQAKAYEEGDGRVSVFLYSDLLKEPVPEEESTHVY